MLKIINESNDPAFNLAVEEYFLKKSDLKDDVMILWINKPTIVIGKNQNAFAELNLNYVKENNINVVRRLSGGGAVYHDLGNLNFTIIKTDASLKKNDFSFFTSPLIQCLKELGVDAVFSGRNDVLVDGKKISGNAQYFYKDKVLHHGTLLFNSDLSVLTKALAPRNIKLISKGISSVRSRVGTILGSLPANMTIDDFKKALEKSFKKAYKEELYDYHLIEKDIEYINELADKKYRTWEWTYGKSLSMKLWNEKKFDSGTFSLYMEVKKGIIQAFRLYGDFFEVRPVEELEANFIGISLSITEISKVMDRIDCLTYIKNFSNNELLNLIFEVE